MELQDRVEKVFMDIWQDIVMPNGEWDLEQIKKELYDYTQLMDEASEVYDYITWGRISKPSTKAGAVIGVYEDVLRDMIAEAVKEAIAEE